MSAVTFEHELLIWSYLSDKKYCKWIAPVPIQEGNWRIIGDGRYEIHEDHSFLWKKFYHCWPETAVWNTLGEISKEAESFQTSPQLLLDILVSYFEIYHQDPPDIFWHPIYKKENISKFDHILEKIAENANVTFDIIHLLLLLNMDANVGRNIIWSMFLLEGTRDIENFWYCRPTLILNKAYRHMPIPIQCIISDIQHKRKSQNIILESGFVYAPYIPASFTPLQKEIK